MNRGRPPIGPLVSIRMPQHMIDALDAIATLEHATRADLVRDAVQQYLART